MRFNIHEDTTEEELLSIEEKLQLAKEKLKYRRELEELEEEDELDDGYQGGANLIVIAFIVIVGFKIMNGTF